MGWEVVEETLKCMQLGLMGDAQTEADGRDARSNASEVCLCIIMLCDYVLAFLCSGKCGDVASECLCVSVFLCMRPSMNQLVFSISFSFLCTCLALYRIHTCRHT